MQLSRLRISLGTALLGSLALAGCGGGSTAQYQGSIVTGKVLMGPQTVGDSSGGPVAGATVCAYAFVKDASQPVYTINYGATPYTYNITPAATCQTTAADGSFSFNLINGVYGPVLLQAYGGSYSFTPAGATANSYTLNQLTSANLGLAANASNYFIASGTTLQAVVNAGGGGTVSTNITPLTTFAVARSNPISGFTVATYQANLSNIAAQLDITGVSDLANAVPGNSATDTSGTYGQAMLGVEQYLATMTPNGSSADDPYSANLLNWTNLGAATTAGTVSADYTLAYHAANTGSTAVFNFN